jgi:cytidylate kinase
VSLRVVAIDGAAGSGKSTLARGLARALGLPYVNTGLMYRALTLEAIERGVPFHDGDALAALMATMRFRLGSGDPPELEVDGSPPSLDLESPDVEAHVSEVAAHPQVRASMRAAQRSLGLQGGVVEGRDIATVVFPEAPLKLYLVADQAERIERRARQRDAASGEVGGALERRDRRDAKVNPFEPPDDAIVLDTTGLEIEDTLAAALEIVAREAPELSP